ncbi:MAG: LPS export ABC transporter periplasmic protein LptC [Deltaproteobacteria bacterium]|nr:LPS export ABC transporter periplasmic protein LptC [Deltaproteobacteria bacterium]
MTRFRLRSVLLVLIVATLGAVGYKVTQTVWMMDANELRKESLKLLNQLPDVALQVKDFRRTKIEGGRKAWELTGEEVRYLKGQNQAVIKKPRLVFYDKEGKTIEATGDEGRLFFLDEELDQMKFQGGIRVAYQGYVLETEEASYLQARNRVVAAGKVTLKSEGLELEGVGMEIALDEDKVRLLSAVKARFHPGTLASVRQKNDGGKKS